MRLGTNILLAALRRPVTLAKAASTLDVLSGGRLDLGVGVGWQREEYDAAGLDFDARGGLLDHSLAVCQTLWREPRASYADDLLAFEHIHQMPKPLRPGGVPVWVSGTVNRRVARRLGQFGTGWIPWGPAAADPVAGIPQMRALLEAEGHDPRDSRSWGRCGACAPTAGSTSAPPRGPPALGGRGHHRLPRQPHRARRRRRHRVPRGRRGRVPHAVGRA